MNENNLVIGIDEKPQPVKWLMLSFQHVFAMFGATILVPILTGRSIGVALFTSGIGTLIYIFLTKKKVPMYLGSSFSFIGAVTAANMAGEMSAGQSGLVFAGLTVIAVGFVVKLIGTDWIDKLLPTVVIGSMIIIIGFGMSANAVSQAGLVVGENGFEWKTALVALVSFSTVVIFTIWGKGFSKLIPFLLGIVTGYLTATALGMIDFTPVVEAARTGWIKVPEFMFPVKVGNFDTYDFRVTGRALAIIPIAFVTISEHIGAHSVLSKITGKNFAKDPGYARTLIGDGVASTISCLIGGPDTTTYGENTGVIGMTKVGSVYVVMGAAVIAIVLSFIAPFTALIRTIPDPVLGGLSIVLFGVIGSNGLSILVDEKVNFSLQRNVIIASTMIVVGLGGAVIQFGGGFMLEGMALAAILGIVLNLVLPKDV